MSQLLALRQAIEAGLKLAMPAFDVSGHLGRFEADELRKFLVKAPAIRVAILGLVDATPAGEGLLDCVARVAVYVVAKDGIGRLSRDQAALAAVETVFKLSIENRWGQTFARPAGPPAAHNLYSDDTLKLGAALWAVEIPQPLRLANSPEALAPLSELWIGLAPKIGPEHRDDYVGPYHGEVSLG